MKLFLIGRPGSGKSTAYYLLEKIVHAQGMLCALFSDYPLLSEMFCEEIGNIRSPRKTSRFQAMPHDSFSVLDFSLCDEVLRVLETHVAFHPYSEQEGTLVVLEFARDEYARALAQFSSEFLRDATCLYIDAPVETCIERIERRVVCGGAYVSEEIMRGYYGKQVLPVILPVEVISNDGAEEAFQEQIRQFALTLLKAKIAVR